MNNFNINEIRNKLRDLKIKTRYSCNVVFEAKISYIEKADGREKHSILGKGPRLCYGAFLSYYTTFFQSHFNSIKGEITSYLNKVSTTQPHIENYMWMTIDQLKEHLDYCKYLGLDFDYTITDEEKEVAVKLDLTRITNIVQIKFILFWLRYAHEYPSALAMIDAYILKLHYKKEELYNLLQLTSKYWNFRNVRSPITYDQSFGSHGSFIDCEAIKSRLHHPSSEISGLVTNLFLINNGEYDKVLNKKIHNLLNNKGIKDITLIDNYGQRRFLNEFADEWFNDLEKFKIYDEMYKIMKNSEIH